MAHYDRSWGPQQRATEAECEHIRQSLKYTHQHLHETYGNTNVTQVAHFGSVRDKVSGRAHFQFVRDELPISNPQYYPEQ